jgi:hypothetical protein
MEGTVIRCADIRRHSDGSIDMDFYRRRAMRGRRRTRRLVFKRSLSAIVQAIRAVVAAIGYRRHLRGFRRLSHEGPA